MARPLLDQQLTFSSNTAQNGVAYVPNVLNGQYVEFTVYIEFSAGAAAGKIQIETSHPTDDAQYAGTWAAVGSTIDWAAESTQKYASVTGVFSQLRLRIDTAVTSGTVKAWIVAAAKN